jgi:hypothetical protein
MRFKGLKKISIFCFILLLNTSLFVQCKGLNEVSSKPRILISTDIGGTDPDDFQSMIHLLMYADLFQIEGLVSSPFGNGRKKDILDMIDLYEKDYKQLISQSESFPSPDMLRSISVQGSIPIAPFKGFDIATEGSELIVKQAKVKSDQPLWVLVWGGLEDLAQALHDAPEIKENIKVYWIGGPNKKWSINAYAYIAEHHPDLWFIEANATYRGWMIDSESPKDISNAAYYDNYIQGYGAMGKDFKNHYGGNVKMGDTPSLAYLMNGNPDDPISDSWGGSFVNINFSSRNVFYRNTTIADTVAAYSVLEWRFTGPKLDIPVDSSCFTFEVANQVWPGYYLGDGMYGVRYSSKQEEICTYITSSAIPELDGQSGQFVSTVPWPGKPNADDYELGENWYGDRKDPDLFLNKWQGAKTVSKFRKEYLLDWAKRWQWLK